MIKALIFDFDGLILETEGPVYLSWCELYNSFGLDLPFEQWGQIIGTSSAEHFDPFAQLERALGKPLDRQRLSEQRRRRELEMIYRQPVLPGVEQYLRDGKAMGLKMGVASSSSRQWVVGHLDRLGLLDYFDCVVTSDDVERTKPDPALFKLALRRLDVEAKDAVVFEDSPNGVLAAKKAGIFVIAVPNELTRRLNIDHADMHLNSLAEQPLRRVLEQVEARLAGE